MKINTDTDITKSKNKFKIGDLVQFDSDKVLGIITDIKIAKEFKPHEKVLDVKVNWMDGEEFWCLEFTLVPVSTI